MISFLPWKQTTEHHFNSVQLHLYNTYVCVCVVLHHPQLNNKIQVSSNKVRTNSSVVLTGNNILWWHICFFKCSICWFTQTCEFLLFDSHLNSSCNQLSLDRLQTRTTKSKAKVIQLRILACNNVSTSLYGRCRTPTSHLLVISGSVKFLKWTCVHEGESRQRPAHKCGACSCKALTVD